MIQVSVSDIQKLIEAQVANPEFASALLSSLKLTGVNSLKDATSTEVAFFFSKAYQNDLFSTQAGLIVIGASFADAVEAAQPPAWKKAVFIKCADPYLAMARTTGLFHQEHVTNDTFVHPTAVLGTTVILGVGVDIGPHVVIDEGAVIGNGVKINSHCVIGKNCVIGDDTILFPRVTLYENSRIGKNCRLHSGVVIGADGFGYAPVKDPQTKKPIDHQKIYHFGNVVIEDHVEIGANSTIDRGTFGSTIIREKVKIDNLVQIGHNCEVGEGSIICGAAGMAGSSSLGKFVTVAAQAGTGNQVHVGDYSTLLPYAGVAKDCPPESELMGVPARPSSEAFKIAALQSKLLRERTKERKKS